MTEHELTSLPGCVARRWNADNSNAGNHGTAQGLVWGFSQGFSGNLRVVQIFDVRRCSSL